MENTVPSKFFNIGDKIFKEIILNDLSIKINVLKENDKYIGLRNNDIMQVKNIIKYLNETNVKLIVGKYLNCLPLYKFSLDPQF